MTQRNAALPLRNAQGSGWTGILTGTGIAPCSAPPATWPVSQVSAPRGVLRPAGPPPPGGTIATRGCPTRRPLRVPPSFGGGRSRPGYPAGSSSAFRAAFSRGEPECSPSNVEITRLVQGGAARGTFFTILFCWFVHHGVTPRKTSSWRENNCRAKFTSILYQIISLHN